MFPARPTGRVPTVTSGMGVCKVARLSDTWTMRTPFGINLADGAGVMVATVFIARAAVTEVTARVVAVALALGVYAALVDDTRASLATAGLGYLLFNGFLVNRYGELTWDGTTSTWHVTVIAAAVGLGLCRRWLRSSRRHAATERGAQRVTQYIESTPKKETHGG